MSTLLFLEDAYRRVAEARVVDVDDAGGIALDQTLFYATGGGQPCDTGTLTFAGKTVDVIGCNKGHDGRARLQLAQDAPLPKAGELVVQELDWQRRFAHMRMHTALHLLSVVVPLPVNGGAITAQKGRLDFDMPEPVVKEEVESALNALIARDLPVWESWITDAELDANPSLVKTMSVQPPRGSGKVRLVAIGRDSARVDLQPCGGTHVAKTSEIGVMRVRKVEKKGRQNRRISIVFDEAE